MADLIDRQTLLDSLDGVCGNGCSECCGVIEDVRQAIEDAPIAQLTRSELRRLAIQNEVFPAKRGEWEIHPDFLHIRSANIHRCSMCKARPLYRMGNEVLSAYCPNCGADMRICRKEDNNDWTRRN